MNPEDAHDKIVTIETPFAGVTVDTGNDWMDFGFAIALFVVLLLGLVLFFKYTRPSDGRGN